MGNLYDELLKESRKTEAPPAAGIAAGIVKENYHKDYPGMVQVEYTIGEKGRNVSGWIPVAMPYTGKETGMCLMPEIGTEVVVGFLMGNWNRPVVLGSLWNKNQPFPKEAVHEKNEAKLIRTKRGISISIKEEEKKESVEISTPKGYRVSIDDGKDTISISDKDGKNKITLDGKGGSVSAEAEQTVELKVSGGGSVVVDKKGVAVKGKEVSLTADGSLKLEGKTVNVKGSMTEIKADGSLKINSSGVAELKGSMVKIN